MPTIYLETIIDAPIERVFDLARSIDLHKLSNQDSKEEAVAGRTTGLIELNETVTWRAKHFGIEQKLTVQIIEFKKPYVFVDVMLKGAFKTMKHTHKFEIVGSKTRMIDIFEFASPIGFLGKIVNFLLLKSYMIRFLLARNEKLKQVAESDE